VKVSIYGSGYVGLVTGACFSEMGHDVLCADVDARKVEMLLAGDIPIYEPGLSDMVLKGISAGTLDFTTDLKRAAKHGECIFIAVGTPPDEDGSADLKYVLSVADSVGSYIDEYTVVVDKSTVPVGTAKKVESAIQQALSKRGSSVSFDVVSNPEFLKEGAAVSDFMKPDRIVIGSESEKATVLLRELYAPFNRNHDRMLVMDTISAELTKYAANSMLATKISFMNEMSNIADAVGADIEQVRLGIGSDPRIGFQFIYPGAGYGGSCFPKDITALHRTAGDFGYTAQMLKAVDDINNAQKEVIFSKIHKHFDGELAGKRIALWGLSFKPNTDDMREAPSRVLMEALWEAGASVTAYDPKAMEETARIYGDREDLSLVDTKEAATVNADALVIMTEWNSFRALDFKRLEEKLSHNVLFDGRNIFDPEMVEAKGFAYYGIGRGRR